MSDGKKLYEKVWEVSPCHINRFLSFVFWRNVHVRAISWALLYDQIVYFSSSSHYRFCCSLFFPEVMQYAGLSLRPFVSSTYLPFLTIANLPSLASF